MISILVYIVVSWLLLSLGAAQQSYIADRTLWDKERAAARRTALKTFIKWPYSLYRYLSN